MTERSPCLDAELVARHAWLLRLARSLAADEAEAEDLAQEAWARVLARGTSAARDLGAYLGGIVRVLAARDRGARRARARREEQAARAEALPAAAELAERLELARILAEELARLPERTRTLLLLHHQEGVPLHAIAAQRGRAASTVRAELARARARLRERLDRRFGGRRAQWALVALRDVRDSVAAAAVGGGIAMHVGWKVGLTVAVLALAGA
jgi:RNA polymerase sigma factor (sigma-70 family)